MSEAEAVTVSVEEPVKEEKTKKNSKRKASNMTKKAPKKTGKAKAASNKKNAKKKDKTQASSNKRNIDLGNGEKWSRKKVGVLAALQQVNDKAKTDDDKWATKPQIADILEKQGMNSQQINLFCHELTEEEFAEESYFEGDPKLYRRVTAKGAKKKLPAL